MHKRIPLNLFISFAIILLRLNSNAQTVVPGVNFGFTQGVFEVTDGGAASYSIALTTSIGTAGLQPKLSISYNSNSGNGILGFGWNLQGLSSIIRTGRNRSQDENTDKDSLTKAVSYGLTYSNQDRFVMDGQRLVLAPESINSSLSFDANYGDNGTVYNTEQNNFTRIVYTVNASGGYFKAFTKDGLIYYYGNTTDSKIISNGVSILWKVNRIEDRKGNFMNFTYSYDSSTGEILPNQINYTGNLNANLQPYNTVLFEYENRPDISTAYGIRYQQKNTFTKRISKIKNLYGNQLIKEYRFSYQFDRFSLLNQISECDANGVCFQPTTFNWQTSSVLPYTTPVTVLGTPTPSSFGPDQFGDFNGDGLLDFVNYVATEDAITPDGCGKRISVNLSIYKNQGNGSFSKDFSDIVIDSYYSCTPFDFKLRVVELNGDNIDDLLITFEDESLAFQYLSNPKQISPYIVSFIKKTISISNVNDCRVIDLNGDGIIDYWKTNTPPTYSFTSIIRNNYGNLNFSTYQVTNDIQPCNQSVFSEKLFFDANLDGLTDILFYIPSTGQNSLVLAKSDLMISNNLERINQFKLNYNICIPNAITPANLISSTSTGVKYLTEDLNGDNLKEVIIFHGQQNLFRIIPNKGNSAFDTPIILNTPVYNSTNVFSTYPNLLLNDFNADGLIDLVFYQTTTGNNLVYLNQGNFTFETTTPYYNYFPSAMFITGTGRWFKIGTIQRNSVADVIYKSGGIVYSSTLGKKTSILIKSILEGSGQKIEIEYGNLLDQSIHGRVGTGRYPYIDIQSPLNAVKIHRTVASSGEKRAKSYIYLGATIHVEGRGFRGFVLILTRDSLTQKQEIRTFYSVKDSWRYGQEFLNQVYQVYEGKKIISSESTPSLIAYPLGTPVDKLHRAKSFFAFSKTRVITDSLSGIKKIIRQGVDDNGRYGNIKYIVNDYGMGLRDSTTYTYYNDETNWIIGRPDTVTKYSFAPNQTTFVEQKTYQYDISTGLPIKEVLFSNLSAIEQIEKIFVYDAYGNIIQTNEKAHNGLAYEIRTDKKTYDSKGRFVITSTNALNQVSSFTYDERLGVVLTSKDPNNLTTTFEYDGFGRLTKQIATDNTWKHLVYRKADATLFSSPTGTVYLTYKQTSDGQIMETHYDSYGRTIQESKKGFNGLKDILINNEYSWNGNKETHKNYYPIYEGESLSGYAQTEYDVFGRTSKLNQTKTNGIKQAQTNYGWLANSQINFLGQVQTFTYNSKNQIVQSGWNNVNNLNYFYDAAGRQTSIVDLKGNRYISGYDARGNQTQMTDPDMGTYQYQYNGFGELLKQTYPNGKVVTMEYDLLGRMTKRTEDEGVTTWVYDVGTKAIGKVSSINSYGTNSIYTYDLYGRKTQEVVTINSTNYITQFTYDSQSRVLTQTYPSGLVLKYVYNSQGYLSELRNNSNNALFWKVVEMDATGNVTKQQFGNNVLTEKQFDATTQFLTSIKSSIGATILQQFAYNLDDLGNLLQRQDVKRLKSEVFTYDDKNRLTQSNVIGGTNVNITYDELGNILSKSDVGKFDYGVANNGPHRLIAVTTNNSNITCSFSESINTVYSTFNKVTRVSNDTSYIDITYGADRMRVMQKMYVRNTLTRTKIYVNGISEIEIFPNGRKVTTDYIDGIGLYIKEEQGNTNIVKIKYFLKDHLGSITGFTGDNGVLLEEISFDAWGNRRNADWTPLLSNYQGFERGFTYHEHYDIFSMIEMNGRVYDPILGRFLSPDILTQDPLNLQTFNRYSYVLNNPLKYTDPTGYIVDKMVVPEDAPLDDMGNPYDPNFQYTYSNSSFGIQGYYSFEQTLAIQLSQSSNYNNISNGWFNDFNASLELQIQSIEELGFVNQYKYPEYSIFSQISNSVIDWWDNKSQIDKGKFIYDGVTYVFKEFVISGAEGDMFDGVISFVGEVGFSLGKVAYELDAGNYTNAGYTTVSALIKIPTQVLIARFAPKPIKPLAYTLADITIDAGIKYVRENAIKWGQSDWFYNFYYNESPSIQQNNNSYFNPPISPYGFGDAFKYPTR